MRETEETSGIGEAEESVGGEDTDSDVSAGDTATTSNSSQEMLGKFVEGSGQRGNGICGNVLVLPLGRHVLIH